MIDRKRQMERYLWRAERYWHNASLSLQSGEADKASEYIWGAVALALKAVAFRQTGKRIRRHQELRRFAQDLAKLFSDPTLVTDFDSAEILHSNFYETEHTLEDVQTRLYVLRPFLHRLFSLARTPS
jgi:HEPN domain-containing protein